MLDFTSYMLYNDDIYYIYDVRKGAHVKKAFFKGCEFAASFFVSFGISAEK